MASDSIGGVPTKTCIGFLVVVGVVMLCVGFPVMWIKYAKPYLKTAHFVSTTCKVLDSKRLDDYTCACTEEECDDELQYPCVGINVTFTPTTRTDNRTMRWDTLLYENELTYLLFKGKHAKCFYGYAGDCLNSVGHQEKLGLAVSKLREFGRRGKEYSCLYNPSNWNEVIKDRTVSRTAAIHAIFWPWFFVVAPCVIACVYYVIAGMAEDCRSQPEKETKSADLKTLSAPKRHRHKRHH
ncbi:PREDICTED: uncharacterized protein LOC106809106 [Priapulus caudatus]|uniref:Uncharacterized protein LOC106809106 n=1 Tax=Priapulus caudatus TaxID=37621 RepID=A0ABM1E5T0_PRICU|nr:PREDICTED: uncharacterized protein LOC106809106 [Priapulus caudatus]